MNTGKYSPWFALVFFGLLVLACFLPWTFHEDIGKNFTGFFSEKNIYGKPGKFLVIAGGLTTLIAFVKIVWLKRVALFLSAINVAYAVTAFIRFGSCYDGYCPERKFGLFLMLVTTIALLVISMLPKGIVKSTANDLPVSTAPSGSTSQANA
jgi:hypothetical protein